MVQYYFGCYDVEEKDNSDISHGSQKDYRPYGMSRAELDQAAGVIVQQIIDKRLARERPGLESKVK